MQKIFLLRVESPLQYRARPAYAAAAPGEEVKFVNYTQNGIDLHFSSGPFTSPTVKIDPGHSLVLTVPAGAASGRYPYSGTVGGQQLQGESGPEIIIDP